MIFYKCALNTKKKESLKNTFSFHPTIKTEALKVYKRLFSFIPKKERDHHTELITQIYLHAPYQVAGEDWLRFEESGKVEVDSGTIREIKFEKENEEMKGNKEEAEDGDPAKEADKYVQSLFETIELSKVFKQHWREWLEEEVLPEIMTQQTKDKTERI